MRIEIMDGRGAMYPIDSLDPELLSKWLLEIFDRVRPDHLAPAHVQVWPSFDRDGKPDWVADSRVLGYIRTALTPEDTVARMQEMIAQARELSQ